MKNLLALICIVLSLGTAKAQNWSMNIYVNDSTNNGTDYAICITTIQNVYFVDSLSIVTYNIQQFGGNVITIPLSNIDSIRYSPYCAGSGVSSGGIDYPTVLIGDQEWMGENLRTTNYANGDPIPNLIDIGPWCGDGSTFYGAWCHLYNDAQFENPYGKLYNWYAVSDPRNVCPSGWHVPTDAEWSILIDYLGGEAVAGGKMKAIGNTQDETGYWAYPLCDSSSNNISGFGGQPGGSRGCADSGWQTSGFWWSSSEGTTIYQAWIRGVSCFGDDAARISVNKQAGYSVRCIRN